MLKLCANLSMLFSQKPMAERFAAARQAGFSAVEIQFPHDQPISFWQEQLSTHQLKLVLINVPAGDLMSGGPGLAGAPGKEDEFEHALESALRYGRELGVEAMNVLPGRLAEGADVGQALSTLRRNLLLAAERMAQAGIRCTVEAINRHDMPGFLISSLADLTSLPTHPNLYWQVDLYHMARMDEDLNAILEQHWQRIGHLQFADAPGRGAPGSGQLPFGQLFRQIASSPYPYWSGAEYRDASGDASWMASLPA